MRAREMAPDRMRLHLASRYKGDGEETGIADPFAWNLPDTITTLGIGSWVEG